MACPFARVMAEQMRVAQAELVKRWLDQIAELVPLDRKDVFPGQDLVDHVPLLIEGVAEYLNDAGIEISADSPVMAKAIELGVLRYEQGFDAQQILKEYEILGNVLFDFLVHGSDAVHADCTRAELLTCGRRIFQSIAIIQQHTTTAFLVLDEQRVREREQRLHGFNRMVSHELRNRLGAAWGAAEILQQKAARPEEQGRLAGLVSENLAAIQAVLENLSRLSRSADAGEPDGQHSRLADIVTRVLKDMADFTRSRGVRVQATEIPHAQVPAAVTELTLSNLITNSAKYRDPARQDRWIRISAELDHEAEPCEVTIRVQDNGRGVPEDARDRLFERYFRAHGPEVTERGSGLGLAIVRDMLETVGGRIWAEFPGQGAVFAFTLPCAVPDQSQS